MHSRLSVGFAWLDWRRFLEVGAGQHSASTRVDGLHDVGLAIEPLIFCLADRELLIDQVISSAFLRCADRAGSPEGCGNSCHHVLDTCCIGDDDRSDFRSHIAVELFMFLAASHSRTHAQQRSDAHHSVACRFVGLLE